LFAVKADTQKRVAEKTKQNRLNILTGIAYKPGVYVGDIFVNIGFHLVFAVAILKCFMHAASLRESAEKHVKV
jgi:hypothetical protein